MPAPFQRSGSMRRIPTKRGMRFKRRKKASQPRCALCGMPLQGVQHKGSKSQKKPTRKFGGHLCHICAARVIQWRIWKSEGLKPPASLMGYL